MKLLVDTHVFDDKHQGTRTYLKGLYGALIPMARHWTFYLVAKNIENLKKEFGEHPNVKYIKLKHSNKFYRLFFELPHLIKKYQINYAHFQYISPLFKSCKYIVTTHDILFEQKGFKSFFPLKYRIINGFLFKLSAKKADKLFTVSEYSRQQIARIYKVPSNRIFITPNAVTDDFKLLNDNPALKDAIPSKTILYVSRVEPRKNHLLLLKAFVDLQLYKKGYTLVFIGAKDFPDSKLLKYITQNNIIIKEHVLWKYDVSFDVVKQYYANCSLFVFPSFAEGFGIPILEAMVFNKKMLVSNETAMKDFNLPEELTFNPYNLNDLKEKLQDVLFSNSISYDKTFVLILSKYSWENSAKTFFEVIDSENE